MRDIPQRWGCFRCFTARDARHRRRAKRSSSHLASVCPLSSSLADHGKETGKLFPGRLCLWIGAESARQRDHALSTTRSPAAERRTPPSPWKGDSCQEPSGTRLYIWYHKKKKLHRAINTSCSLPWNTLETQHFRRNKSCFYFAYWITREWFENIIIWNLTPLWHSMCDISVPARAPLQSPSTHTK